METAPRPSASLIRQTLAGAVFLAVASGISGQTVQYNPGDLLAGFQATGGTGAEQTLVFNLGYSVDFRDNPAKGFVYNLGPVLSSIYGPDWFDRPDLYWGIAGVRDGRNPQPSIGAPPPVVDGDPSATVYVSKGASGIGASTPWTGYTRASLVSVAGTIRGLADLGQQAAGCFIFQPAAAGTDNRGAIIAASLENSWAKYNPEPGAAFGILTGGVQARFGAGTAAVHLDLYRILASNNGADPAGTVGTGSLVTTFTIDREGNMAAVTAREGFWYERPDLVEGPDGWLYLPWFGWFYPEEAFAYQPRAGWLYGIGDAAGGLYLWDGYSGDWLWTSDLIYPWVYNYGAPAGWRLAY